MVADLAGRSLRKKLLGQEINPAPPASPLHSEPKATGNLLDTQIVIVLGAVLCVLICAVWLHSVVRCMLRRNRRGPVAAVTGTGADPADESATGLDPKVISALPVVPASVDGGDGQPPVGPVLILSSNTECIVCLQEFGHGEDMKLLPNCGHGFHVECIGAWLMSHSSCPICRHGVLEPPSPSPSSSPSPGSSGASSMMLLSSPAMRQMQYQLNSQLHLVRLQQQQQQQQQPDLVRVQHFHRNRFNEQLRQFYLRQQQQQQQQQLQEPSSSSSLGAIFPREHAT